MYQISTTFRVLLSAVKMPAITVCKRFQQTITCSKSTIKTLKTGVKYVQS